MGLNAHCRVKFVRRPQIWIPEIEYNGVTGNLKLSIKKEMIQILLVKADPLPFLRERHGRHLGGVAHLLVDNTEQSRGQT